MTLTLELFIETLTGQPAAGAHPVQAVVFDSREAAPGVLFLALPGESGIDGHTYAADALARGALAVVIDRDLDLPCPVIDLRPGAAPPDALPEPPLALRVENVLHAAQDAARRWSRRWLSLPGRRIIGITGSVGKTTSKELIADVLAVRYPTLRSQKSYNNEIGIPLSVLRLRDEHERAVLEMSMYVPGEITLLAGIAPPQVGVVTLIAPVHLERAGTMEAIVDAKAELVEALPPGPAGVAILNRDDARVMSMAGRTRAAVVTYGLTPEADVWAGGVEGLGLDGSRFTLHHRGEQRTVHLPLLGQHNVETALRAAAVGFVEGLSWDEVVRGLETTAGQVRLVAVDGPHGALILDDTYNASPPSVIAALNLLRDVPARRRIAVLGDMLELGSAEEEGHRQVGAAAAAVADLLITVGERGRMIGEEALRRGLPAGQVRQMQTDEEAAAFLLDAIGAGDAVLVKGSRAVGMERIVARLQQAARQEQAQLIGGGVDGESTEGTGNTE